MRKKHKNERNNIRKNRNDGDAHGGVAIAYAIPALTLASVCSSLSYINESISVDRPATAGHDSDFPEYELLSTDRPAAAGPESDFHVGEFLHTS